MGLRLKFADRDLERAFVASHGRAFRSVAKVVAPIVTLAWVAALGIDPLIAGSDANALAFLPARLVSLAVLLSASAFMWRAKPETFERYFEGVLLVAAGVGCAAVAAIAWQLPEPERFDAHLGVEAVLIIAIATYTMLGIRMYLITPIIVGFTIATAAALAVRWHGHDLETSALNLAFGNVIGWFAGYNVERYRRQVFIERGRSERLIRNVLPEAIAERLKDDERRIAEHFPQATVLFADLVGFTRLAERLTPAQLVTALDDIFSEFDDIADRHGLEKIKTIGDAYMVVGGVPAPHADHVRAIAEMALEMRAAIAGRQVADGIQLALRIGIHTGPVVAGVIGKRKFIYDLWGDTVNLASRMESHGVEGGIQVTEATRQELGDVFRFEERGVTVKGKGELRTFLLLDRQVHQREADEQGGGEGAADDGHAVGELLVVEVHEELDDQGRLDHGDCHGDPEAP
jgi:class 3 adenylate cyclase